MAVTLDGSSRTLHRVVDAARTWPETWRAALFQGASAAIVAVFCYSTVSLVPALQESYWAPIAAVVVLYPDREATRKAAIERFVGTIVGSLTRAQPAPDTEPGRRAQRAREIGALLPPRVLRAALVEGGFIPSLRGHGHPCVSLRPRKTRFRLAVLPWPGGSHYPLGRATRFSFCWVYMASSWSRLLLAHRRTRKGGG
jgi:hypothetical protein